MSPLREPAQDILQLRSNGVEIYADCPYQPDDQLCLGRRLKRHLHVFAHRNDYRDYWLVAGAKQDLVRELDNDLNAGCKFHAGDGARVLAMT